MDDKRPMSPEKKAHLRWWIAIATFSTLLFILNYRHLPSLFAEVAKQALTIAAWGLWVKAFADIFHRFADRRPFTDLGRIVLAAAVGCLLLLWFINQGFKEVLGVLYFALAASAVILVVFRPPKKP